MTIPDELVQAAVEAPCLYEANPIQQTGECHSGFVMHPECVIAAAFAKLSECEAAVEAASRAECPAPGAKHAHHVECLDLARSHLRALAREFGGCVKEASS